MYWRKHRMHKLSGKLNKLFHILTNFIPVTKT